MKGPSKICEGTSISRFLGRPSDTWELIHDLPDKDAMSIEIQTPWRMYFDGAARRGGAGAGVVFIISQERDPTILPYFEAMLL